MQFIDNAELIRLTNILNQLRVGSYYLSGRMEAFVSSYGSYSTHKRRHHSRRQTSTSNTASAASADTSTVSAPQPPLGATGTEVDVAMATLAHMHTYLHGHEAFPVDPSTVIPLIAPPSTLDRKPHPVVSVDMLKRSSRRRTSSLGDLSEPSSRALLLDFVTALNEAFPDHDFADSKIEQFKEIDTADFMRSVNACLAEVTMQVPGILEQIWAALDELIDLHVCEVFAFVPDESDDDVGSNLWDFYFFLFNRDLDKLIYFSCSAKSVMRKMRGNADDMDDDDDDDDDDNYDMDGEGGMDDSGMMDPSAPRGPHGHHHHHHHTHLSSNSMNLDEEDGYDDTQAFDDEEDGGEAQGPDWDGII